jgi:hypothetical protein
MKNLVKTTMIAAVALILTAGAVSAQSLKADIPFAFRAAGVTMPAGSYRVDVALGSGGTTVFRLHNQEIGRAVLPMATASHDARKEWKADGKARIAFACGTDGCELVELWKGGLARDAYQFSRSKGSAGEGQLTVIGLNPATKGE